MKCFTSPLNDFKMSNFLIMRTSVLFIGGWFVQYRIVVHYALLDTKEYGLWCIDLSPLIMCVSLFFLLGNRRCVTPLSRGHTGNCILASSLILCIFPSNPSLVVFFTLYFQIVYPPYIIMINSPSILYHQTPCIIAQSNIAFKTVNKKFNLRLVWSFKSLA